MENQIKKSSYNKNVAEFDFVREPEILDRFDEKHTMDIELREQEIELLRLQENHSYEFSKITVETQLLKKKAQLSYNTANQRNLYLFLSVIFIGIVSLIVSALVLDKDSIAMETIKTIITSLASGLGGYGLRHMNSRERSEKNADSKS